MSFNHFLNLGILKNRRKKGILNRKLLCLFIILVFLLNFLYLTNNFNQNDYYNNDSTTHQRDIGHKKDTAPISSGNPIPLLQDPFTINLSNVRNYFTTNFKTNLGFDVSTYIRDDFSKNVFSEDNLLLYKSLERINENFNEIETLDIYSDLKSTPLWIQGNVSQYEYGFVRSIEWIDGNITDNRRFLIDNLMPIFLLLENAGQATPNILIEEIFKLVNSSIFWDGVNGGFLEFNSSSSEKDTKSNLYSILANLLIYQFFKDKSPPYLASANRAFELANLTIIKLMDEMWDDGDIGFYYRADPDWNTIAGTQQYKHLDVNALGIITLIDFWIATGMDNNSSYFKNATLLYEKLDEELWETSIGAYNFSKRYDWQVLDLGLGPRNRIDLEANSIMMQACLKLFEVTGNFKYYNRSIELFKTFESKMYDTQNNAYRTSIGTVIDNNKNFTSNLRLSEAYLKAFEIYNSTVLDATFNTTNQVPDYIINQDVLNLTCDYAYEKTISFSKPTTGFNTTRYNDITKANITYIIKYPNGDIFDIEIREIKANTTNLSFLINESFPIENGYTIQIYANTTYFGTAFAEKNFNVISGLVNKSIIGLDDVDLYQGRIVNITLPVNNTRNDHITLNVTLEGFGIENATIMNVNFTRYILTNVSFNLTIREDAPPGKRNISFKFKNGSILYLEVVKEIEIVNALTYSNLIYHNKIVAGNHIQISMNLINFFPNATQSFNVSFSGNYINDVKLLVFLAENQMKTVFYNVFSVSIIPEDSIEIEMSISVGETIFYTEILTVEIIPKFEIISLEFSEDVIQGVNPHIIIIIQNNLDSSEEFTLIINDEKVSTDLDELSPGENRIEYEIERLYNPYEFGTKTVVIEIEDESEDSIVKKQFEYEVRISAINIIFFYLFPILIPIAVILFYKNKDIKNKLLRR